MTNIDVNSGNWEGVQKNHVFMKIQSYEKVAFISTLF